MTMTLSLESKSKITMISSISALLNCCCLGYRNRLSLLSASIVCGELTSCLALAYNNLSFSNMRLMTSIVFTDGNLDVDTRGCGNRIM